MPKHFILNHSPCRETRGVALYLACLWRLEQEVQFQRYTLRFFKP